MLQPEAIQGYEHLCEDTEDGEKTLSILVSGVHCAGCIQKIESSLSKEEDITGARLNFSSNRLVMRWKGNAERANDYVSIVQDLGYGVQPYEISKEKEQVEEQKRFLLLCLGVAGFAMGNVMLLSVGLWITTAETMGMATRDLMHWIAAMIAMPTVLFSGRPFFRSAITALRAGHTNMDVPISIALFLACAMSLHETITHGEHVYFDSAVMLLFFLLIGRYLDFRARGAAQASANDLLSTFSGFAQVLDPQTKQISRIPIRDVREEMLVRVATAEKFPVDGIIVDGASSVDTSLVTGETLPREIAKGDEVFAGTMNLSSSVTMRVAKAAKDSLLSDIVRLMEKATQAQARYVRLADKAARLYTPVVHTMAALAFIGWWLVGGIAFQEALLIAVTVLIITCPCALGLAVPVVQVLATGKLMRARVLVKSGDALERLAAAQIVLMDKTGTITAGKPQLIGDYDVQDLQLAASLASHSAHPLSRAVLASYEGELLELSNIEEVSGKGVRAQCNGKTIRLGSRKWCGDISQKTHDKIEIWLDDGSKKVCFLFEDQLRADSKEVISALQEQGLKVIILSGDRREVVENVAAQVGVDTFYAEMTPPEKFEKMESFKQKGQGVLMIGDGLNDAPVLAGADISMAPGSAIDMAQNAADIVFMGDDFAPVLQSYKISQKTQRLVKENFALAVIYNMIAIPLALCGMVTPLVAAIAMSGSSLLVIGNSFRLKLKS